jgi:putative ABC transport system permease protein
VLGSVIAYALLEWRIKLDAGGVWWLGVLVAFVFSGISLALGARYLLRRLRLSPALLLRSEG